MGNWLKLNIGSSARCFPGFENIDRDAFPGVKVLDIRLGLPYPGDSAAIIVASHCLEHLHPVFELPQVLQDIHRVLRPGGTFRVAVPDLKRLAKAYLSGTFAEYAPTQLAVPGFASMPPALQFSAIAYGNYSRSPAFDGHHACWDAEAMTRALQEAGFTEVGEVSTTESRDPELLVVYRDIDALEQCILEATK